MDFLSFFRRRRRRPNRCHHHSYMSGYVFWPFNIEWFSIQQKKTCVGAEYLPMYTHHFHDVVDDDHHHQLPLTSVFQDENHHHQESKQRKKKVVVHFYPKCSNRMNWIHLYTHCQRGWQIYYLYIIIIIIIIIVDVI